MWGSWLLEGCSRGQVLMEGGMGVAVLAQRRGAELVVEDGGFHTRQVVLQ